MKHALENIQKTLSPFYSQGEISYLKRIIFEHLKGWSMVDIIMHKDSILSPKERESLEEILRELALQKPIQYILGYADFCGLRFIVNENTLIPRPETEELINLIVEENNNRKSTILDIGTGTGCIAISLAHRIGGSVVEAIDISPGALKVATENAKQNNVVINFSEKNALSLTAPPSPIYDIIVSNPPYICDKEKESMEVTVKDFEPSLALFVPDNDPLLFYRAIATYAFHALKPCGRLYFEINNLYSVDTCEMLNKIGFVEIKSIKDIHGLDRFVSATRP